MIDTLWYIVRTNPRCEDRAAVSLAEAGFSTYSPQGQKLIRHHRSKKIIERSFPLMVGYLFLEMPVDPRARHWGQVRACDGVKAILGVDGTPQPVPSSEVEILRKAEEEGRIQFGEARARALGIRHGFEKGSTVLIEKGPWSGFAGTVTDARSRSAIRVLTQSIGGMREIVVPVGQLARAA